MKFRIARHTTALAPIIRFYTDLLGLNILGNFKAHAGYDGVFIGLKDADWHLEFTVSLEPPLHQPDEDDLLVFYLSSEIEYQRLKELFKSNKIDEAKARNPYWLENGTTYQDPDGYKIVLTITGPQ